MKKTITLILLSLATTVKAHDFDLNFSCRKALQKDIQVRTAKYEKTDKIAWKCGLTLLGIPVAFTYLGISNRQYTLASRSRTILKAMEVAFLSREEILTVMQEEALPGALNARKEKLIELNRDRKHRGLTALTQEEYDVRFPMVEDLPQLRDKNPIDHLVKLINETSGLNLNYAQVRNFLQVERESNYFCPNDEAPKMNKSFMKLLGADVLELSSL